MAGAGEVQNTEARRRDGLPAHDFGLHSDGATTLFGTSATDSRATTSTTVASTSAAALPVGACSRTFGGPSAGPAWVPRQLAGAIPPTAALHLEFYSIGTETLLGPRGWSCAQLTGADGSAVMDVYPQGAQPDNGCHSPPSVARSSQQPSTTRGTSLESTSSAPTFQKKPQAVSRAPVRSDGRAGSSGDS